MKQHINDTVPVLLIMGIFAAGVVDIRLFYGYLFVAWLGNAIKEESDKVWEKWL